MFHGRYCTFCESFASFNSEAVDRSAEMSTGTTASAAGMPPTPMSTGLVDAHRDDGEDGAVDPGSIEMKKATDENKSKPVHFAPCIARGMTETGYASSSSHNRIGRFVRAGSGRYMLAHKLMRADAMQAGREAGDRKTMDGCGDDRHFVGGRDFYEDDIEMVTWCEIEPSHVRAERMRHRDGATGGISAADVSGGGDANRGGRRVAIDLLLISPLPEEPSPMVTSFLAKDRKGVVQVLSFYFGTLPRELFAKRGAQRVAQDGDMFSLYGPRPHQRLPRQSGAEWRQGGGSLHRGERCGDEPVSSVASAAAPSGKLVIRWFDPHVEVLLDGSRGAKIDSEHDVANMRVMNLIGQREVVS